MATYDGIARRVDPPPRRPRPKHSARPGKTAAERLEQLAVLRSRLARYPRTLGASLKARADRFGSAAAAHCTALADCPRQLLEYSREVAERHRQQAERLKKAAAQRSADLAERSRRLTEYSRQAALRQSERAEKLRKATAERSRALAERSRRLAELSRQLAARQSARAERLRELGLDRGRRCAGQARVLADWSVQLAGRMHGQVICTGKAAAGSLQELARDGKRASHYTVHQAGRLARASAAASRSAAVHCGKRADQCGQAAAAGIRSLAGGLKRIAGHAGRIAHYLRERLAFLASASWERSQRLVNLLWNRLERLANAARERSTMLAGRLRDWLERLRNAARDRSRQLADCLRLQLVRLAGALLDASRQLARYLSERCARCASAAAGAAMRLANYLGRLAGYPARLAARLQTRAGSAKSAAIGRVRRAADFSTTQAARCASALDDNLMKLANVPTKLAAFPFRLAHSMKERSARNRALARDRQENRAVESGERADRQRRVLILVENLPSPFDRRVWQEANALRDAGYLVSIICPTGKGYEKKFEDIGGIHIWRYDLPFEANGALGYLAEYATALTWTWILSWRVFCGRGFDVIHACNPPDLLFLIGGFFKLFGRKFLFDHHDINPELYEAKFGRRDFFYRLLLRFERWSFGTADVSIATNESYRRIAIERGGMPAARVFVVRSGPSLERMKIVPPDERLKRGRRYLVGYVGVMGKQEGIDCLLRAVRLIVSRHQRTDIQFGLVGGGTSLEEMKALAVRLGVADYVTFTGRVPDAELLALLNTAEVCVNPDIASEMNDKSTMNKIMEYMALGKPIVQFDLTEGRYSARGAALNARPGDIADFAARILELLDNAELRQRMGAAGRERVVTALSWDHEVPRLLAAYECLWESGRRAARAREASAAMGPLATPPAAPPAGAS